MVNVRVIPRLHDEANMKQT